MKKLICLTLALAAAFCLSACELSVTVSSPPPAAGAAVNSPARTPGPPEPTPSPESSPSPSRAPEPSPSPTATASGAEGVAQTYFNMFRRGLYHIKTSIPNDDGSATSMEIFAKGGMTAVTISDDSDASSSVRIIDRDGQSYFLMDSDKSYFVNSSDESSADNYVITGGMTLSRSGRDQFNGKSLPYVEFINEDGSFAQQYFVSGDTLAGIRSCSDGYSYDMIFLSVDQKIPDGVFDIPGDYQEITQGG